MSVRRRKLEKAPDIEIGAKASARRLRFRRKPKTKVEFEGKSEVRSDERIEDVELDSESKTERRNLPEKVEPGVTYHDVEVGWVARARARLSREGDEENQRRSSR